MTGEIIIEAADIPEDVPKEAVVLAYNIRGNAVLSDLERIGVMYHMGAALGYTEEDWQTLMRLVKHEPPFDGLMEQGFQIGASGWVEDDDEPDA